MKRLTQLLAVFIVLYLIVSAVRPDISQNWRDDWRALFQSDSPSTALVSTPVPPTNAPMATPTPLSGVTESELTAAREYALTLVNQARTASGLKEVSLGENIAIQQHAETSLANCFGSHWGVDGLKPYMRYSLAGGYQSNGENGSSRNYCIKSTDGYVAILSNEHEIRQAMQSWMESPDHRRNILDRSHRKVNIGIARDKFNFVTYHHFEGDYVLYSALPNIDNGNLSFAGSTKNGAKFEYELSLGVQIFYDPPTHRLTTGQVSRTYCYDNGLLIAALRLPLKTNQHHTSDSFTVDYAGPVCPDPYDVPTNALAPRSVDEAHAFWQKAYDASQSNSEITVTAAWITATEWSVTNESFAVSADISDLLDKHGDGVYTIVLWREIEDEHSPISEYSIFIPPILPPN